MFDRNWHYKKTLLLIFFLSTQLFPQVLKEFDVQPTTNRGQIPIFRDFPDKAAIIFYTKFSNLTFSSSFGIYKELGDPEGGKYIIVVEPTRQTIEVRGPGYKTEQIKIGDLQPRDVLYYEITPKKEEGISGISELAVTFLVQPSDATIKVDNNPVKNDTPVQLTIGDHTLVVEKPGFNAFIESITVGPNSTFFRVNLTANDPVPLVIESNPSGAEIFIDGLSKGKTRKALFLYPGTYELRLSLSAYLSLVENITISSDEKQNNFSYNLIKNTSKLKLEVTPPFATVRINKEVVSAAEIQELTPGTYQIEVEAETYYPYKGTVEIVLGQSKIEQIALNQKVGKLQFGINPAEANCVLSVDGIEKFRWTGFKIIDVIPLGEYLLTATCGGYKTIRKKISIMEGKTTVEDLQMESGSELPDWLVFVDGKEFEQDGQRWNSFYISKYEVTQELWKSVMVSNPSFFPGDKRPVERVTWTDAVKFCNRLSDLHGLPRAYKSISDTIWDKEWGRIKEIKEEIVCKWNSEGFRLPTEAEWEFASKGGRFSKNYDYSGSDIVGDVAWGFGNSDKMTHNIGLKFPNELGLYDMSGNVWEWCWDYNSKTVNTRIRRGGSWYSKSEYCKTNYSSSSEAVKQIDDLGFRIVRTR